MNDPSKKSGHWPKKLADLMQHPGTRARHESELTRNFGRVLSNARTLDMLGGKLASILDPALTAHCRVAQFRNHCLVLVCSSAAYASRIRMISQQLLESLREEGVSKIDRIDIRVAPINTPQPAIREPRILSSAAFRALGRFAADSDDVEIHAIFEKIKTRRNRES